MAMIAASADSTPSADVPRYRMWQTGRQLIGRILDPASMAGLVATFLLWQLASLADPMRFPGPVQVFGNAFGNLFSSPHLSGIGLPRGGYFPHLLYTATTVLEGGLGGALVGTLSGLCSAQNRIFHDLAEPVVSLLGTIPIVVAAPFFLMWFGISTTPQLALVAFYSATVLHVYASRAAGNQPPHYAEFASTLGAGARRRFVTVLLPGVLPELFGGIRIALAAAWGLAAVTELLGGQAGTGRVLSALKAMYDITGVLAVVVLLGMLAILVDLAVVAVQTWATRWRPPSKG